MSDSRELWQDRSGACCCCCCSFSFSFSRSFALSLSLRRFFSALLSFVEVVVVGADVEVAAALEPNVPKLEDDEERDGGCSKPFCAEGG